MEGHLSSCMEDVTVTYLFTILWDTALVWIDISKQCIKVLLGVYMCHLDFTVRLHACIKCFKFRVWIQLDLLYFSTLWFSRVFLGNKWKWHVEMTEDLTRMKTNKQLFSNTSSRQFYSYYKRKLITMPVTNNGYGMRMISVVHEAF